MSTVEQRNYAEYLRGQVDAAGLRVRVKADVEGYPVIPGRYGQVEYYGAERGGEERLRVWSGSRGVIGRLRRLSGVNPQQIGDSEARCWFRAGEPEVLRAVCGVIKARVKREGGGGTAEHLARIRPRGAVQSEPQALGGDETHGGIPE